MVEERLEIKDRHVVGDNQRPFTLIPWLLVGENN